MTKVQKMIDKIEDHDWGEWPEGPSYSKLSWFAKYAEEAMTEFVQRVDDGSIRSTYTYNKFKKILGMD